MAQVRQCAKGEGDRFRVTLELSQVVHNVFKPSEKPEVRHGRPVFVVPGAHGRLSNIDEHGLFIEDEVFLLKGKQKVRKAKTSAGNLLLSWRKLRDQGDEESRAFFRDIEVMQQPSAFLRWGHHRVDCRAEEEGGLHPGDLCEGHVRWGPERILQAHEHRLLVPLELHCWQDDAGDAAH